MISLYTIAEILDATGGQPQSISADAISSISIDSRDIRPGALFVAIKGENFDGHDFADRAIAAGAAVALVGQGHASRLAGLPLIIVPDALEALYALARYARARSGARIVAVTGSAGKTSTKEAISAVLSEADETHASIKSFNNHWGVPLTLARMPATAAFGVFEIGMNHAGEITPLSQLVQPHLAMITTVAPAHLEFFDSVEAIADAKAEIFAGLVPGGLAILGADHPHIERLLSAARTAGLETLTYGFAPDADVVISGYRAVDGGGAARLEGAGIALDLKVPTPGRHTLANAVGALIVAHRLGLEPQRAAGILAEHGAPEGRGLASSIGPRDKPLVIVDESYNANPVSMRAALDVFAQMSASGGRRVLVLGDMRELGPTSRDLHLQLRDDVVASGPDAVYLVGQEMAGLAEVLPDGLVAMKAHAATDIAPVLMRDLAYGDLVMIKGSNGLRLGALVGQIRDQFGD